MKRLITSGIFFALPDVKNKLRFALLDVTTEQRVRGSEGKSIGSS
jgi:hypothetical protein